MVVLPLRQDAPILEGVIVRVDDRLCRGPWLVTVSGAQGPGDPKAFSLIGATSPPCPLLSTQSPTFGQVRVRVFALRPPVTVDEDVLAALGARLEALPLSRLTPILRPSYDSHSWLTHGPCTVRDPGGPKSHGDRRRH